MERFIMAFVLEEYMSESIEKIIKNALKASFSNPKQSIFLTQFALSSKIAQKRRTQNYNNTHIPPFLIASITSQCNLYCKGCYSRANNTCHDTENPDQLATGKWSDIFQEATDLGINFILLAGGEPLMRKDVIETASKYPSIIFPIFTNGTMIDTSYKALFNKHRNLLPVISIEGDISHTDHRRGEGMYNQIIHTIEDLQRNGTFYGLSITVSKDNINMVTSIEFLNELHIRGAKLVVFVEYVPVDGNSGELALDDHNRDLMEQNLLAVRNVYEDMVIISFPGDEKSSGGCLAAGRGFFHINPTGQAEPCPFSPFSDSNLKDMTLLEALQSPLFQKLRDGSILLEEHTGGCVLFEQEAQVKELLKV